MQEPRFLLPMALPLAILFGQFLQDSPEGAGRGRGTAAGSAGPGAEAGVEHMRKAQDKGARTKSPGRAGGGAQATSASKRAAPAAPPGTPADRGRAGGARRSTCASTAAHFSMNSKVAGWLLFNALLLGFFGALHQGGVSRALHWLARLPPADRAVLWTHTYMPPVSSLLLAPLAMRQAAAAGRVAGALKPPPTARWVSEDLAGAPLQRVVDRLEALLMPGREVYVVGPGSVRLLPLLRKRRVGGTGRGSLEAISDAIREEERKRQSAAQTQRQRGGASLVHDVAEHLSRADAEVEVAASNREWVCPISKTLMKDPVAAADGYSYEREAITSWIAEQRARGREIRSPVTERVLETTRLTPNRVVKISIEHAVAEVSRQKLAEQSDAGEEDRASSDSEPTTARTGEDGPGQGRAESGGGCEIVQRVWPHLSMEDPPSAVDGLSSVWSDTSLEIIRCRVKLV